MNLKLPFAALVVLAVGTSVSHAQFVPRFPTTPPGAGDVGGDFTVGGEFQGGFQPGAFEGGFQGTTFREGPPGGPFGQIAPFPGGPPPGFVGSGVGGGFGYAASGHPLQYLLDEAAARSAMMRARGATAYDFSEAMKNFREAQGESIENYDRWTDVFLERIRAERELSTLRAQEMREEQQRRLQAYRQAQEIFYPETLNREQFDPDTGEINWPTALQEPEFTEEREQLEELFAMRTRVSQSGDIARKASVLVRLMEIKLKNRLGEIPQREYVAASQFLDGLRYNAWVASR